MSVTHSGFVTLLLRVSSDFGYERRMSESALETRTAVRLRTAGTAADGDGWCSVRTIWWGRSIPYGWSWRW